MRIDQLRAIIHVSETGSISKSAELLYMSQQGLSHSIKSLENELGGIIFERSANKLHLTEEGKLIIVKAKEILLKYEEMLELFKSSAKLKNKVQELNIFVTPYLSKTVLQKSLSIFYKKNPHISPSVVEQQPLEMINSVRTLKNAIGLISFRKHNYKKLNKEFIKNNLDFKMFCECDFFVSVSPNFSLSNKKFLTPKELIRYPIVAIKAEQHINSIYKIFEGIGKPNIKVITSDWEFYQEAITNGLGIGVSGFFPERYLKKDSLINIPVKTRPDSRLLIGCIYLKEISLSAYTQEFIELLESVSLKDLSIEIKNHKAKNRG